MLNLEQVKLLETKIAKTVEYVERVTGENAALHQKEEELQATLESYQKRIDELEIIMMQFKEEQGQIEDGILSALDKLNRFEEAMEKSLKGKPAVGKNTVKEAAIPQGAASQSAVSDSGEICFEIPENNTGDIIDPLRGADPLGGADSVTDTSDKTVIAGTDNTVKDGELEIY